MKEYSNSVRTVDDVSLGARLASSSDFFGSSSSELVSVSEIESTILMHGVRHEL